MGKNVGCAAPVANRPFCRAVDGVRLAGTMVMGEFEGEMELERARWLRRRFLWLMGVLALLLLPVLPIVWLAVLFKQDVQLGKLIEAVWSSLEMVVYVCAFVMALVKRFRPRTMSAIAMLIITLLTVISLPMYRVSVGLRGVSSGFESPFAHVDHSKSFSISVGDQTIHVNNDLPGERRPLTLAATRPARAATVPAAQSDAEAEIDSENAAMGMLITPGVKWAIVAIWMVFSSHFVACIFMPWTLRESLIPGGVIVAAFAATISFDWINGGVSSYFVGITCVIAAGTIVPGALLCWWRHSVFSKEFRLKFESGRYQELRSDLLSARRIHETCLPAEVLTGPALISYAYRPMRDIGGDLIFHRSHGDEHLVAIIDVTGHGIAAALTVNRLLGELERIVAEHPDGALPSPGQLLTGLNEYTRLILAEHGLYLSAMVFAIDPPSRTLRYASAGHPTAFVLSADRKPEDLESTAPLLGVLAPEEFEPAEVSLALAPGQLVLAYTDGATDTQRPDATTLRTAGLRELVESIHRTHELGPTQLASAVLLRLRAVRGHDEPEDDTLIVVLGIP